MILWWNQLFCQWCILHSHYIGFKIVKMHNFVCSCNHKFLLKISQIWFLLIFFVHVINQFYSGNFDIFHNAWESLVILTEISTEVHTGISAKITDCDSTKIYIGISAKINGLWIQPRSLSSHVLNKIWCYILCMCWNEILTKIPYSSFHESWFLDYKVTMHKKLLKLTWQINYACVMLQG